MRLSALFLVLLALGGCCMDRGDRIEHRYYGTSDYANVYVSVDWRIPANNYGGDFTAYIDDVCPGCSGTVVWSEWDDIGSVGFEVYDAPYSGQFALNGWYQDRYGWVNICDDPPQVYIDGWYDVYYDEYYDSYGWNCDLVYEYY